MGKLNRKRDRSGETADSMTVRIRCAKNGYGPGEMKVYGSVDVVDMDEFMRAVKHFEDGSSMKCYLNLGDVEKLCGSAVEEIVMLGKRIEERGDMFAITDISPHAEVAFYDRGFREMLKPLYSGLYKNYFH